MKSLWPSILLFTFQTAALCLFLQNKLSDDGDNKIRDGEYIIFHKTESITPGFVYEKNTKMMVSLTTPFQTSKEKTIA